MPKKPWAEDLRGHRFGRLLVLKSDPTKYYSSFYCQCDCGTRVSVRQSHLKSGGTRSCGCAKLWLARRPKKPSKPRKATLLTYDGKTQNITEWAAIVGLPRRLISNRIHFLKWSVERALTIGKIPPRERSRGRSPKLTISRHSSVTSSSESVGLPMRSNAPDIGCR